MNRVIVGMGSCGLAAGAREVFDAFAAEATRRGIDVEVGITGCLGLCYREVLVTLESETMGAALYGNVQPEDAEHLLQAHFVAHKVIPALLVGQNGAWGQDAKFFQPQQRIALRNCGHVDPESLDDFLSRGGYVGLTRALRELTPDGVVEVMKASGLRGRGGAGFPTGRKWELARASAGPAKVVICNADEGDPGAFMDRNLIEGDPFAVLEGLTIAARAIGAQQGYVYVRDEYPLAVQRLDKAIATARTRGYLGRDILGAGFDFDVVTKRGAGAFVCGEETAMIASLEGERGTPRRRPPYPVEQGLHGRPTSINNVETLASVPWILANGADAYAALGTGRSRGTKVFSLTGDVRRTGLVEIPMGVTIGTIVEEMGGGSPSGRPLKAVQIGGPSGGCLPRALFATPVDYESLQQTGAIMGSGGLVAMDDSSCMVDVARYFLSFTQEESCGKCTFCRIGTKRMLEILTRLCEGNGRAGDLELLEELSHRVGTHSLCGLGRSAPNPVLTTLRYFREEYEGHLYEHRCPAKKCRALIEYTIDPFVCDRCTLCYDQCAARAILGTPLLEPMAIDPDVCLRCGGCLEVCRFHAVTVA